MDRRTVTELLREGEDIRLRRFVTKTIAAHLAVFRLPFLPKYVRVKVLYVPLAIY